jgi:hypothetical protein
VGTTRCYRVVPLRVSLTHQILLLRKATAVFLPNMRNLSGLWLLFQVSSRIPSILRAARV